MLTERELDELKKKHEAATPGAVLIERRDDEDGSLDFVLYAGGGDVAACFETSNNNARNDAEYLAALHNAFPELERFARLGLLAAKYARLQAHAPVCSCPAVNCTTHRQLLAAARALDGGGK